MHFSEYLNGKFKLGIAITGGGSEVISMLLREGGMSGVLDFAAVPYSHESLARWLPYIPNKELEKAVSPYISNLMAHECYEIVNDNKIAYDLYQSIVGIGATCALVKREGEREGRKHHGYLSLVTNAFGYKEETWKFEFDSVVPRSRFNQETIVSNYIFYQLFKFLEYPDNILFQPAGFEYERKIH